VERVEGDHPHVYKSVLLSLTGNLVRQCVQAHSGTILWHGQSPYRANHKRKNWYIGVQPIIISSLDEDDAFSIDEQDLQIETMRATGPGGQNVNRRETAVRVVHRPTGYTVVAREERSQWMNKKLAMARLYMQLSGLQSSERHQQQKKRWQQHNELERGNPIMKFSGSDFRKVDI
jgi:peptide chain release factor